MKVGQWGVIWGYLRTILLWIALPLIIGILIAAAVPRPVIGMIYLDAQIDSISARTLIDQIDFARSDPNVKAVVFVINSPGGTVADTESVYQELLSLRKTKPVVVSIGAMAASGAYYLSSGADYIIADPTSEVGNIGVIGYLPDSPSIFETTVSTGPYKLWGEPRDTFLREMEMIKQGFYEAVKLGRGSRLKIGPEVVLTGRIWPGNEALRAGLIDALGSQSDAVDKAGHLANIANYKAVDVLQLGGFGITIPADFFYTTQAGVTTAYPNEPGLYLLYVPPMPVEK